MTNEIENKITKELSQRTKFFDIAYDDGEESDPKEYEDDNFIHISRGKVRYCFYNGQDEGRLTKKDIPRFAKMIDDIIEKMKEKKKDDLMAKDNSGVRKGLAPIVCSNCDKQIGWVIEETEEGTHQLFCEDCAKAKKI